MNEYIKKLITVAVSFLFVTFAVLHCNPKSGWAQADLQFMCDLLLQDHPSIYNQEDQEFKTLLASSQEKTVQQLNSAQNDNQRIETLKEFAHSFNDGHIGICFDHQNATKPEPDKSSPNFQIKHIDKNSVWVTLPTFMIESPSGTQFDAILEQLPYFQKCESIIFDVRGNRGGNSFFVSQLLSTFFGTDYYKYHKEKADSQTFVDWRASSGNYAYLQKLQEQFNTQFGSESTQYIWVTSIVSGMSKALENNEPFYTEKPQAQNQDDTPKNVVTARIFIIIDKKCGSACLDFIDDLYAMNHPITLIGETTSSDSLYMEARFERLPSDRGDFYFPIKVYRNRPRGHNVPYCPDIKIASLNEQEILKRKLLS